jgi:hypothetical protein
MLEFKRVRPKNSISKQDDFFIFESKLNFIGLFLAMGCCATCIGQ